MLEYQNIKTFLKKAMFQIDQKSFLSLKKSKTLCHGHVISDLNREEIVGTFYEKKIQKKHKNPAEFRVEKNIIYIM